MLSKDKLRAQPYIIIVFILNIGCKEKIYSQDESGSKNRLINCYITKPVKGDSKADTWRDFEFSTESLQVFLNRSAKSSQKALSFDSAMEYVTSFERQRLILVNRDCFKTLDQPDTLNLMELYFNTGSRTRAMNRSIIEFRRSFRKDIYNFGNAMIFEYEFKGVAEVEPHFMYIILKEQTKEEERYGRDYQGFVICSDGLEWKDYGERGASIVLFKQIVRRSKELCIPLYYDGERFTPIGHFKSDNWKD